MSEIKEQFVQTFLGIVLAVFRTTHPHASVLCDQRREGRASPLAGLSHVWQRKPVRAQSWPCSSQLDPSSGSLGNTNFL